MLTLPCAKINIGLYITAKRPDGYHDLETVFYPIPLRDQLEITRLKNPTDDYTLRMSGNQIECHSEDNLVTRVYRSLQEEFQLPPVDVFLRKNIPTGAGLGGGSSDAAFMMRALNEEFQLELSEEEMERRMAGFGADCAFFIKCRPAYATGIGDVLTPFNLSLRGYHLLLVKPDDFVSTREAYAGVRPATPSFDLRQALSRPIETWRETVGNDFEKSVFLAHPNIAAIKETLYDMGSVYACMSGSGSTVFGIFRNPVEDAHKVFENCFVFTQQLCL